MAKDKTNNNDQGKTAPQPNPKLPPRIVPTVVVDGQVVSDIHPGVVNQ